MMHLHVATITMNPTPWALDENITRLEAYIRAAACRRAQLVVAPESVLDGYVCGADPDTTEARMRSVAQDVDASPYLDRAAALCRDLGIHLVFGFLEIAAGRLYNSCVMLDPGGERLALYRKVHPTNEFGITPGHDLNPIDTPFGRVGFLICNDASVHENFSTLGAQQVDIIIIPNNGGVNRGVTRMFCQRAIDNATWIIHANTCSTAIISARGECYLEKYESECISVQRLDLFDTPRADAPGLYAPSFMGRRPDLYGPMTTSTEPLTLFDAQGNPTPTELQNRLHWLQVLRGYMTPRARAKRPDSPTGA